MLDPGHKKAQTNLVEAEARVPRPTIINLPPFKDKTEIATAPTKPKDSAAMRAEQSASVSKRESRISVAYQDGLNRFRQRRYQEALGIFQWLLEQYPTDVQASNCEYWIGESYFGLGEFKNAYAAFKRVTSYNGSTKRIDALTMMKRAVVRQRQTGRTKGVA